MSENSIYNLLNDLCMKVSESSDNNILKRLKRKVYDGLLFSARHKGVAILPAFDSISWHLLVNGNNNNSEDRNYHNCLKKLKLESTNVDQHDLQIVLRFLFASQNFSIKQNVADSYVCRKSSDLVLEENGPILTFNHYDNEDFELKVPPICHDYKYSNESFILKQNIEGRRCKREDDSNFIVSCRSYNKQLESFSIDSTEDIVENNLLFDEDVWSLVLSNSIGNYGTWECLGTYDLKYEPPFLCECSGKKSSVILYLQAIKDLENLASNSDPTCKEPLDYEHFVADVKNLLVGIPSKTFEKSAENKFSLRSGCYFLDLSIGALNGYVQCFLYCANNYLNLDAFCGRNLNGYIMKAFRLFLLQFLPTYRVCALSLTNDSNLLTLHKYGMKLENQLRVLAPIFEVVDQTGVDGVSLLNYLYNSVVRQTSVEVSMVLYSALYKCLEMYFTRFLQKWIFSGVINDPYDEFFIGQRSKYSTSRERNFWSKNCQINSNKVPDFLQDLKDDILLCGKSVKLLMLCMPNSPLWNTTLEKYHAVTCCFGPDQLIPVEKTVNDYYDHASELCKPHISIADVIFQEHTSAEFLNAINKKRQITLKRLKLEKIEKNKNDFNKKQFEKSLYREVLDKQVVMNRDIERDKAELERKFEEATRKQENLKHADIEKEKKKMVEFYTELMDTAEEREKLANKRIESLLAAASNETESTEKKSVAKVPDIKVMGDLDVLNANDNANANVNITNANFKTQKEQNDSDARQYKLKTLTLELGIDAPNVIRTDISVTNINALSKDNLTALQRNKLKVMSSEFDININVNSLTSVHTLRSDNGTDLTEYKSALEINRARNLRSSLSLGYDISPRSETVTDHSCEPMSIGTTPVDPFDFLTPNSTAESIFSSSSYDYLEKSDAFVLKPSESMHSTIYETDEAASVYPGSETTNTATSAAIASNGCLTDVCYYNLKLFLQKSVAVPLYPQLAIINRELLKFFISEQQFFHHLENLRKYFFMLDGEFSRHLCNGLFTKLYEVRHPTELINFRTLQSLIYKAIDWSVLSMDETILISFRVSDVPDSFNMSDPDVLECLSLSYRVEWPLNILLPNEAIAKYDRVFKYLIKLHHISWVLQKIFHEMKVLVKRCGSEQMVMKSKQYRCLQRFRHIMTHFMQTLQNYTCTEIVQSWEQFLVNVQSVRTLDELYSAHIVYIKNIMFMCLLNKKSTPLSKVLHEIFIVVLKFYHYLCSRHWTVENGEYVHPNFNKLQHIFNNFQEYVQYLFKLGCKVAKVGYQSEIMQLLDLLDINGYYSSTNL